MKGITKKYSNGEVTIVWKPDMCIHSGNCFRGLNEVFDPRRRPWIIPDAASSERIIEQVKKCPSGALSYFTNNDAKEADKGDVETETLIEPSLNGPLLIHGNVAIKDRDGNITRKEKVTAFCRCGGSGNKPFCDGTHRKINFVG